MEVLDCGHESRPEGCAAGYGKDAQNKTLCYDCCAENDRKAMIADGHSKTLPLYLSKDKDGSWSITNWPGSLRFRAYFVREGRHNIARTQTRAWFNGPDGFVWSGVQIGEWTQVFHARRTKQRIETAA